MALEKMYVVGRQIKKRRERKEEVGKHSKAGSDRAISC